MMSWSLSFGVVATLFAVVQGGNYDYCEVLGKSLLFYQAQRSGRLTGMSPVLAWREDSAVDDHGDDGLDLEGGYYDAGDHVKFGFPFSYSMTTLAWGLLEFKNGYDKCGLFEEGLDALMWGINWLRKAHVRPDTLYGQVGLGQPDHSYWGRPECMTMERPAFYINPQRPGCDLAAEAAAAFAATSLVVRDIDTALAAELRERSKELYALAYNYRGKYSDSITDADDFYSSWSYGDELVWGAAWVARATGESWYLQAAEELYEEFELQWSKKNFGWDSKASGADVLLTELTGNSYYYDQLVSYCDDLQYSAERTPLGLVYFGLWGSLRSNANAMLICAQAARLNINSDRNWVFVKEQIDYMLGDSGHSYVVGFGNNPPERPHHRASSCPADPCDWDTCNWSTYRDPNPNPNILYGALVGGPDEYDNYVDRRDDVVQNEVALDYNAGFQGVIAALAAKY